jgi:hypothetical protein
LITGVWLFLSVATGLSWYMGSYPIGTERRLTAIGLMTIAMVKVRLVILYFMEVRCAPRTLRLTCDAWVLTIAAVIFGFYLLH